MDFKSALLLLVIIVAFVVIHVRAKKYRDSRCERCGGKMFVFEYKTKSDQSQTIVSAFQIVFNPNKSIIKIQCKKCGHIQPFGECSP